MGGGGPPGSPQAGLPFGGIPQELQGGVDLLLKEEPDRGESTAVFTQLPTLSEKKRLSLSACSASTRSWSRSPPCSS